MKGKSMQELLKKIYPNQFHEVEREISKLIQHYKQTITSSYNEISEKDVVMIAYADSFTTHDEPTLTTMHRFYQRYLKDIISIIHILPFYPYTSDDGFSVVDFRKIEEKFGTWAQIETLQSDVDLMFDLVANHVSASSTYFKKYLNQEKGYENFFLSIDPTTDLSAVTRPRVTPVLTPFKTVAGEKHVWTTFSEDQVDLNYEEPKVLLEILDVLMFYILHGARLIRFDAIGFIWKIVGTTCMHLEQAHAIIKVLRIAIDAVANHVKIITETNVKHDENISYFGNGHDEASLVYQFPLPPLVINAYTMQHVNHLTTWLRNLPQTSSETMFFNFLASHDGIGLRPIEGIIGDDEKKQMIDILISRGAKINYRSLSDGSKTPYECCITFVDALSDNQESDQNRTQKIIGAHRILLSLQGLPAIYYHALLGSRNDEIGYELSKINRRINREKLDYSQLSGEIESNNHLRNQVFTQMKEMIQYRIQEPLFHPNVEQNVIEMDVRVFALKRSNTQDTILTLVNVSENTVDIAIEDTYINTTTKVVHQHRIRLESFESGWFKKL